MERSEIVMRKSVLAELVVKKGAGHGWRDLLSDQKTLADWFDKYLAVSKPKGGR
jgi:hypothetical protein